MESIEIKMVDFDEYFPQLEHIRHSVFITEQNVPIELEWDEYDNKAIHILAYYGNKSVGTARLLKDGHIGRMAVLKEYRNNGVGKNMLNYLVRLANERAMPKIELSAQKHAIKFYEKYGFEVSSKQYMDAGIPHYDMVYTRQETVT